MVKFKADISFVHIAPFSAVLPLLATLSAGIVITIFSLFSLAPISVHGSVVGSIRIGAVDEGYSPFDIAINQVTNTIYATSPDSSTVAAINASTNNLIGTISVGYSPVQIAVNPSTNLVYVGETGTGAISIIDGSTNTVLKTLQLTDGGDFYRIAGIAVNEVTNRVYVLVNNDDADQIYASITIIDGLTNDIEQTFKVADLPIVSDVIDRSTAIAVNSMTNTIYVTLSTGSLYVIDGSNNKVLTNLQVGRFPHQVEVNEETNKVYLSDFGSGLLFVVDGLTNKVLETVWVGHDPQEIAIDSVTSTIYVAGPGLVRINGSSHQVESRVEIGQYPTGVAINQNNGLVYVTRWGSDSIFFLEANQENIKGAAMPLSPLRQNSTSGNTIVELGWEFATENDVTLLLSFFDRSGMPLDYMEYDLLIRNSSDGQVVQEFSNQTIFFVGSHNVTLQKGDNIQIDVVVKGDNQNPMPNDRAIFDIMIVPEFGSALAFIVMAAAMVGVITITKRFKIV